MNLESLYREEWRRVLATTVRLTGDFDLSEEAVQDAFVAALEQWPRDGTPASPYAWLVSTARNRVVDQLRRRARLAEQGAEMERLPDFGASEIDLSEASMLDDQLRLIFTCCHPAVAVEAQVALTLRTVCGLSTEEIARGFLVPVATMAQRLVRVKHKIRDAHLPFAIPPKDRLAERLDGVMLVVYLVFTEGYAATSGKIWIRRQLCEEAIRLGRLLCELIPRNPELRALLALMLLHDSRRMARASPDEEIITLEEQDRELWDQREIAEGVPLLEAALREGARGEYALQAAIAALHARAERSERDRLDADRGLVQRRLLNGHRGDGIESRRGHCDGAGSIERAGIDRRAAGEGRTLRVSFAACRESRSAAARGPLDGSGGAYGKRWPWFRTIRTAVHEAPIDGSGKTTIAGGPFIN